MNKLALGTAQFGSKYGIANKNDQIKFNESVQIFNLAKSSGISLIDTAISYGESEKIIGRVGIKDFKFVTKLPALPEDVSDVNSWVEKKVQSSLTNIGTSSLYGILVHKSQNLLGNSGKKMIDALNNIKHKGFVSKIGVSIYSPTELDKVMDLTKLDIIQAPLNIVDRRLEMSGWLKRLNNFGIEIHTRSTFLQGLLLMDHTKIPKFFNKWRQMFDKWFLELEKNNLNPIHECLSYPLSLQEVNQIVVGVDSFKQLKDLIATSSLNESKKDWSFMISNDQMLINPYNWKKL